MGDQLRQKIRDVNMEIEAAEHLLKQGLKHLSTARETMQICASLALENSLGNLPISDVPITQHRREHRAGVPAKIDNDPELKTFIRARIERLSFQKLAEEVAQNFPKERHVSRDTIRRWFNRNLYPNTSKY